MLTPPVMRALSAACAVRDPPVDEVDLLTLGPRRHRSGEGESTFGGQGVVHPAVVDFAPGAVRVVMGHNRGARYPQGLSGSGPSYTAAGMPAINSSTLARGRWRTMHVPVQLDIVDPCSPRVLPFIHRLHVDLWILRTERGHRVGIGADDRMGLGEREGYPWAGGSAVAGTHKIVA